MAFVRNPIFRSTFALSPPPVPIPRAGSGRLDPPTDEYNERCAKEDFKPTEAEADQQ